jgi:hypothetical protein
MEARRADHIDHAQIGVGEDRRAHQKPRKAEPKYTHQAQHRSAPALTWRNDRRPSQRYPDGQNWRQPCNRPQ